jgi:hypothetical protein
MPSSSCLQTNWSYEKQAMLVHVTHYMEMSLHTFNNSNPTLIRPAPYVLNLSLPLSSSFSLRSPALAFTLPSANPTALAKLAASSYFLLASSTFPSISKNSPRLWVATAQPTSHSSLRSGGLMAEACARALVAHWRACSIKRARGGVLVTGKSEGSVERVIASEAEEGDCWARQVEMLFTGSLGRR